MNNLIKYALSNSNNFLKTEIQKINPKQIQTDKKKEFLLKNNIGIESKTNIDEENEEYNDFEIDDINNKEDKLSKTTNNFNIKYTNKSTGFSPPPHKNYLTLTSEAFLKTEKNNSKNKKLNKPIVDQFEYIKKIQQEQKRLNTHYDNIGMSENQRMKIK